MNDRSICRPNKLQIERDDWNWLQRQIEWKEPQNVGSSLKAFSLWDYKQSTVIEPIAQFERKYMIKLSQIEENLNFATRFDSNCDSSHSSQLPDFELRPIVTWYLYMERCWNMILSLSLAYLLPLKCPQWVGKNSKLNKAAENRSPMTCKSS